MISLQRIVDGLDKAFKSPRTYYPYHIHDDTDVITKEESEKRINFLLVLTGMYFLDTKSI